MSEPAEYRHWVEHVLRFGDLDTLGHVNNVAFATLFESARVTFANDSGLDPGLGLATAPYTTVLARLSIDFRAEMQFPGRVRVGTRVARVGRTSCVVAQGLFRDHACTATSEAVCVLIDTASRRPIPIPDAVRARLAAFA